MADPHLGLVLRQALKCASSHHAVERSDAELLHDYRTAADPESFAALVRRHGPLVWRVCRQVLGHHQDAEDAFQATFLVLARKAGTVRAESHLAGFLHGVAYRAAMSAKRSAARRRGRERQAVGRDDRGPGWEVAWREVQALLHEEIDRLPERYRVPFLLCYIEGMGRAEAARQLGLKEGTVWSRLAEARNGLRARLARRGIDLSAVLGGAALASKAGQSVPLALQKMTIDAALACNAGKGAAGVSSAGMAALVRGVTGALPGTRLKLAMALLFLTGVLATGVGLVARPRGQEEQAKPESRATRPAVPGERGEARSDSHGDPLPAGAILRIGTRRYRTGGGINQAVVSPDGKTLAAASEAGITLFDLASGKWRSLRETHVSNGFGTRSILAFCSGGKELIHVTEGGNLRVWDVTTGKLQRQFGNATEPQSGPGGVMARPPAGPPTARWFGVWSVPGSRFLVASLLGRVQFLDPSTGKAQRSFQVEGELASIAPNGKRLVVITEKRTQAVLYDDSGKERRRFPHTGKGHRPTLAHGGKLLVTSNKDSDVFVWDTDTGKQRAKLARVEGFEKSAQLFLTVTAVTRDGKTLLGGTTRGDILRWDLTTGKALKPLWPHRNWVTGLFCQADGRTLVSVSWDSVVRQTDLTTGKTAPSGDGFAGYACVARSPVGPTAAIGDSLGRLELWDTAAGKHLRLLQASGPEQSALCFSGDGKLLAVGQGDGAVDLWDTATGKTRQRWKVATAGPNQSRGIWFESLRFHPDGRFLVTSTRAGGTCLWEVATGKEVWRNASIGKASFSSDGRTLATGGWNSPLRLWDAATGKARPRQPASVAPNEFVDAIVFSPDGRALATCHHGGAIYLRDAQSGEVRDKLQHKLQGFAEVAWDASFSPDGKWLTASGDNEVRVWEVATGMELVCFKGHEGRVYQAVFGADGRTVLSSSLDLTALLWDLRPRGNRQRKPDELWADLAGDPVRSYRALWALVDDPKASCALLRRKINPVKEMADAARVRRLVEQLDGEEFHDREAASRALAALGERIEATLREALKQTQSAEVRRRLRDLLGKLKGGPTTEELRHTRAVHALELCGTAEARQVLRAWAGGAREARLTRDARAALERLEKTRK
jgi:RNA polymerase sigma factor (sigma-70 family)